ncbi:MAG TPA: NAD(P)-dependent oxidoreductase, partial [Planctomycetaceae bacterium]|nr:NAD(P)-dependent oxidoreductase [Planctomycetaceae bacterium]
ALAAEIGAAQVQVAAHAANLADRQSAAKLASTLSAEMPKIDLVVQAVGQSDRGNVADLTRERLVELLDANVVSSLHAIQAFRPGLAAGGGVVALIGSLSSLVAPRFLGGYSIAKHGLTALAQQARLELASEGIHVMLCCPGPIARPDAGHRYDYLAQQASDMPEQARRPGGGAKIKGLEPDWLSDQILRSAASRRPLVILPRKVWWLRLISCLSAS